MQQGLKPTRQIYPGSGMEVTLGINILGSS